MKESEQRHDTLRINVSEEAALMELLNFMLASPVLLTQSPLPDGIPVNTTLIKVVRRAQSSQKSRVISI